MNHQNGDGVAALPPSTRISIIPLIFIASSLLHCGVESLLYLLPSASHTLTFNSFSLFCDCLKPPCVILFAIFFFVLLLLSFPIIYWKSFPLNQDSTYKHFMLTSKHNKYIFFFLRYFIKALNTTLFKITFLADRKVPQMTSDYLMRLFMPC